MATRGRKPKTTDYRDEYEFVNLDFNKNEREAINDWIKQHPLEVLNLLTSLFDHNYKLSLSQDKNNDTFIISATQKVKSRDAEKKLVLMIRHSDIEKALSILNYVTCTYISDGDILALSSQDLDW